MGKSYSDLLAVGQWPAAVASFGLSLAKQRQLAEKLAAFANENSCTTRQCEFFLLPNAEEGSFWMAAPTGRTAKVLMYMRNSDPTFQLTPFDYDRRQCAHHAHVCDRDDFDSEFEECPGCEYDTDWCTVHENYHY